MLVLFTRKHQHQFEEKYAYSSGLSCHCTNCQVEDLLLDVIYDNYCYNIFFCYRHPKSIYVKHFNDALESVLTPIHPKRKDKVDIFAGDFNTATVVTDFFQSYDMPFVYTSHILTFQNHW